MFIRTAGERDLADISALLAETWHATYDSIYGVEGVAEISRRWHSVEWLRQMLRRDRSEFIVADTGTELAGVAYAVVGEDQRGVVELHELDVRPALQGRGVGGLLLEEMIGSFYESRSMRLDVEEKNRRAVAFYEAAGFVTVGRRPATQWVDAMVVTMERQLG
jgi:ribosomal protein S18 acetylase RimI-like enzyme